MSRAFLLFWQFLSTPSARRATHRSCGGSPPTADFYPRPPRGGRQWELLFNLSAKQFLSTPSARRATVAVGLYTLVIEISIHALREEGDDGRFHILVPVV